MSIAIITVVAVLALGIILFLVKRAVGLFIKLVLFGLLILLLLGGSLTWWWYAPGGGSATPASNTRPTPTRPARTR
ncbi:MAG TPA: hypothetical protein VF666_21495 [Pyrinomonadaceae bacterium]|jgi:hypothetical protein